MEKQVYELKIDSDLHDLIPPLTEEEYRMLEDSIVRDGCDTPLTVWNGIIVDGHNRYEICMKHQIPFAIEKKEFADKEAAMFWMLEHQLARRNLNLYQRGELVLQFEPMLKAQAKKNQGARNDLDPNFRQNSAESSSTGYSSKKMAEMAGVSHDTIKRVKKIKANADEDTKRRLRSGELSIHRAYNDIMGKEHMDNPNMSKSSEPVKRPSIQQIPAAAQEEGGDARPLSNFSTPVSGMAVKDGKLAHVKVGLPDTPEEFTHVVQMLKSTQDYYITAFRSIIEQYSPSMISPEHNELLQGMIDSTANAVDDLFNDHIKEDK